MIRPGAHGRPRDSPSILDALSAGVRRVEGRVVPPSVSELVIGRGSGREFGVGIRIEIGVGVDGRVGLRSGGRRGIGRRLDRRVGVPIGTLRRVGIPTGARRRSGVPASLRPVVPNAAGAESDPTRNQISSTAHTRGVEPPRQVNFAGSTDTRVGRSVASGGTPAREVTPRIARDRGRGR